VRKRTSREAVVLKFVDEIRKDEPRVGTRKLRHRLKKRYGIRVGRDWLFGLLRKSGRLVKVKKSFQKPRILGTRMQWLQTGLRSTRLSDPTRFW
jgi:hypothetical protein